MLHSEYLRGADEVGRRELHVDGRARRVQRAPQLIAHRQHLTHSAQHTLHTRIHKHTARDTPAEQSVYRVAKCEAIQEFDFRVFDSTRIKINDD